MPSKVPSTLSRLGWHATLWASTIGALTILKGRLSSAWEERSRDAGASDAIIRHFEAVWEEGVALTRALLQDFHRKVDSLFEVDGLMRELENVEGCASDSRNRKIALWEELKIEGFKRVSMN